MSDVSLSYGEREVLRGISVDLTEHRIGIVGANGSGKSTLARLVNGLVRPSAGTVTVELTVGADGKATHIHTKGFDEEVDRCLCEKLSALHFETLSGGEVKASYPFYFSPPAM